MESVWAQLQWTTQELDNKLTIDEALLRKQSKQVEKMQLMLEEMQTTRNTLVDIMTKIQDHIMQEGDQDKTSNVDEKPIVSESIPSLAQPSGETSEIGLPYGRSF